MIVNHLSIVNFKNIKAANVVFSPKVNCFIGKNGVGKTNMLDAIYYLSFCHSAFNPVDSQIVTHDEGFMVLEGSYLMDDDTEEHIYCGLKRGERKHFKRNKKEYKRLSQHIGLLPLVMVSPSDNELIDGGSESRRKFMDVAISQIDSHYLDALNAYNKALQQRNVLLKMEEEPDVTLLDIWEREMAKHGEAIYNGRTSFVERIRPVFQRIHEAISAGHEQVSLRYVSHGQRGPLLDVIQRDRAKDRIMGYSLHGIHRDDLEMLLGNYPLRREGSQGQNKTFVLALKLALFEVLKAEGLRRMPLLLLDDIFDKLDAHRVEQIIRLVGSDTFGQIFITDTNREHLDKLLSASTIDHRLFEVDEGVVTEITDKAICSEEK